jgi:hypothetical protein
VTHFIMRSGIAVSLIVVYLALGGCYCQWVSPIALEKPCTPPQATTPPARGQARWSSASGANMSIVSQSDVLELAFSGIGTSAAVPAAGPPAGSPQFMGSAMLNVPNGEPQLLYVEIRGHFQRPKDGFVRLDAKVHNGQALHYFVVGSPPIDSGEDVQYWESAPYPGVAAGDKGPVDFILAYYTNLPKSGTGNQQNIDIGLKVDASAKGANPDKADIQITSLTVTARPVH